MAKFLIALAFSLAFPLYALAGAYGVCETELEQTTLIAPPLPIESVTEVTPEIQVIVVRGKPGLGDSVIPVHRQYSPKLHTIFGTNPTARSWIGVRQGVDGDGDPALWMRVYVESDECIWEGVGERVYDQRANAPNAFWDAVLLWEQLYPLSALVPAN